MSNLIILLLFLMTKLKLYTIHEQNLEKIIILNLFFTWTVAWSKAGKKEEEVKQQTRPSKRSERERADGCRQ